MIYSRHFKFALMAAILSAGTFGCKTAQVIDNQNTALNTEVSEADRQPASAPVSVARNAVAHIAEAGSAAEASAAMKLINQKFASELSRPLTTANMKAELMKNPKLDLKIYDFLKNNAKYAKLLNGSAEAKALQAQADQVLASVKYTERQGGIVAGGTGLNPHAAAASSGASGGSVIEKASEVAAEFEAKMAQNSAFKTADGQDVSKKLVRSIEESGEIYGYPVASKNTCPNVTEGAEAVQTAKEYTLLIDEVNAAGLRAKKAGKTPNKRTIACASSLYQHDRLLRAPASAVSATIESVKPCNYLPAGVDAEAKKLPTKSVAALREACK